MDRTRSERFPLHRREVVAAILAGRGDGLVVTGLGSPCWDVTAAGDHPLTFPLWGSMGASVPIGLGLALARPERRVLVITGDGEFLMGLGSLATVAAKRPANLTVVVCDNERYGETGMQLTHTAYGVDLTAMAAAADFPVTATVCKETELDTALPLVHTAPGPVFLTVKIRAEIPPLVTPPRDGVHLKERFRTALLGEAG